MKIRKTYTPNAFKQTIKQLKAEGHMIILVYVSIEDF